MEPLNAFTSGDAWGAPKHRSSQGIFGCLWNIPGVQQIIQDLTNRPLEHTPNPQPTVYEGIPFIWGFGDVWGMLQGYVGCPLEITHATNLKRLWTSSLTKSMPFFEGKI